MTPDEAAAAACAAAESLAGLRLADGAEASDARPAPAAGPASDGAEPAAGQPGEVGDGAVSTTADEEDDWETSWETNMPQLHRAPPPPPPPAPKPALPARAGRGPDEPTAAARAPAASEPRPSRSPSGSGHAGPSPLEPLPATFEHVLEVSGFLPSTGEAAVEAFLTAVVAAAAGCAVGRGAVGPGGPSERGAPPAFSLRWLDDTHALAVFGGPSAALAALRAAEAHPDARSAAARGPFRLRPFTEAGPAARAVPPADLLPPKARPKGTAAVARRLIGAALGGVPGLMQTAEARRERAELAADMKLKRAARSDAARAREETWGE